MAQKPYVNLGCGNVRLPVVDIPLHYPMLPPSVLQYPLWVNVDRNKTEAVDWVANLFTYPWPFPDNSFDGALLSHIIEHIPHEVKPVKYFHSWDERLRYEELERCQDGWYAFFAELWRVLTPGAQAHFLSPYAWSQGAVTDPTHTRFITEHSFTHSLWPEPGRPFEYDVAGLHYKSLGSAKFAPSGLFSTMEPIFWATLMTQINVVNDIYAALEVVKPQP